MQLNASGAPEGQEFDRWEITGLDTTGLNLTNGALTFTMPAAEVTATATYKAVAAAPTEPVTEDEGEDENENGTGAEGDVTSPEETDPAPQTGDSSPVGWLVLLLAVSACGVAGALALRREDDAR